MSSNLIIVESPAKAKTIQKFIGKDYEVISSKGHVRDLPNKDMGVDISKNFLPNYEVLSDKKALVADIKKKAQAAETVWLATDDDREGEAISWHLMESAKIPSNKVKRIVFHEITKSAIEHALTHPRQLDIDLVNAQQARRILDRIVGFELSPVLWRKVKPSLSAGRVQSVSVRLIVDREHEITKFQSSSAYKVSALFQTEDKKNKLDADLNKSFTLEEDALKFLEDSKTSQYHVQATEKSPGKKSPAPPFTTSSLQQEASRKFGFSPSKTMLIAQHLYESGYITYMRTDSLNLSALAIAAAKEEIETCYGKEYVKVRKYVTKSKGAQEAHEAIRPSHISNHTVPGDVVAKKLYELIWKRTIASQMSDAQIEKTIITIPISNRPELFLATGEVIIFPGFLRIYTESTEDEEEATKGLLPAVKVNEKLLPENVMAKEKYAQAPARYSEAGLVKKLEELGIGRPSTYAPTIATIQKREYVSLENRPAKERTIQQMTLQNGLIEKVTKKENYGADKNKLFPTDIGIIVNDYLEQNFENIIDYGFTAQVEEQFDEIAEGKIDWKKMLNGFYGNFHTSIDNAIENSSRASGERLLGQDPKTGEKVTVRLGRYGPMAQIGETSEDKKPRYARLQKEQSIESISLEEALSLFALPRTLTNDKGVEYTIAVGRFGPYIKIDSAFVTLPKTYDPYTVTFDECTAVIEAKKQLDKSREPVLLGRYQDVDVFKAIGRYGPYIKYDGRNVTIGKNIDYQSFDLEKAIALLSSSGKSDALSTFPEDEHLKVMNGRYGAYIARGKDNYKIPSGYIAENLTYKECQEIISTNAPTAKRKSFKRK